MLETVSWWCCLSKREKTQVERCCVGDNWWAWGVREEMDAVGIESKGKFGVHEV